MEAAILTPPIYSSAHPALRLAQCCMRKRPMYKRPSTH
ncbi:hypothetical protein Z949_3275 [Sulfitobacter guttiformis KCTC 32187]|nr:hypothetical protein Z949_3275 [Sulfitobacter guttiformis KCTC 32187]